MKPVLRVLIVEDSEDDALLVLWNIKKGPYDIQSERVDNEVALLSALDQKSWDIILCDYALPGFSGFEALTIVRQKNLDIPFIFVSGTMGEDIAVEAMHMGAHDYVMKGNLTRLLPAIERELKEARVRKEKRAAEAEILKAKNDWEKTFDAVPDLIFLLDTNFRIVRANKAMADKLKISQGDCINQTCYRLVHGTDQPHELCPHVRLMKDGNEHTSEIFEHNLGGDFLLTTSPLYDDTGKLTGSVHVARDITERKKAEIELRENEERFRSLFNNNLSVMILIDPLDGAILDANQSAINFYGWPREVLLRKKISDINNTDSNELLSLFQKVITSQQVRFEFKHKLADGSLRDVEIFSSKIEFKGKEYLHSIIHDITDRKKAEQELEHERYLMQTLMDNFPDAIYFKDRENRFTRVSRNLAVKHNFLAIENIIGKTDAELFTHEHARQAMEDEKKIMETGTPLINYEEEETYPDGSKSWVLTTKLPLYDSKGDITGTFGISKDITERRLMEEDLRRSEERFKHVAEITGEWIWEMDQDGLYTYASPVAEKVLGYKPEEIIGKKHFYDFYHPDEKERLKSEVFEFIQRKVPFKKHINAQVHKNGKTVYIETNGVPILDKKGNLTGYRGADADQTERILSVQELAASERRFRGYFELPITGITITSPDKGWIEMNDSFCRMLGYEREELMNLHWPDLTFPPDLKTDLDHYTDLLNGKINQYHIEKRIIGKKGRIISIELAVGAVRREDGSIDYIISTVNDISERKNAEEELKISEDKFRMLIENQGEGVTLVNENEVFTFANPAAEQIFGVEQGGLINRNLKDFVSSAEYEVIRKETGKRTRLEKSSYEIEITTPSGEKKDILVTATPQTDKEGKYIGTFGVFRDITFRKKAENDIKLSLSLLQATLDSTTDGIVVIDMQGRITGYNKQFQLMWNVPDDRMQSGHSRQIMHFVTDKVTDSGIFIENARQLHSQVSKKSFDILSLTDGRIVEHYSIPQILDNKIIGRVWSFRDITDRMRAEEERKLSEQKYRELADFLPSGIFEASTEGLITYANRVGLDWIGYNEDELYNRIHVKDLISGEDREKALSRFALVMKNNETHSGEYAAVRKDGSTFPALVTSKAMIKNGKVNGLRGVITDLTHFKQAEEALRSSEEKYKRILETSVEGVLSTDMEGKIAFANDAFSRMLGFSNEELIGVAIDTLIAPEEIERHHAESERRKHGIKAQYIRRFVRKNGTIFWTLVSATPVYDEKGNFAGSFAMLSDITSQKEAELELQMHREHLEELVKERTDALLKSEEKLKKAIQEAESANRAKSEFLANMSHEIRTPMNAILGYSEILHRLVSDPVQKDYLNSIQLSGKTLLDLINNVLDLSKIEVGKLNVMLEPVNLRATIMEIASIFKLIVKSKGLDLFTQIEENFPAQVMLDELKIRQILINLINNAIKFTDSGFIRINARYNRNKKGKVSLEISVQDTGKGISKKDHQFVFEPFAQTAGVDKKKQSGTGLGLTISRQLAELLHGTIVLESEEEKGSIFTIVLNDVEVVEEGQVRHRETVNPDSVVFRPASVMVTDDDLDNRKVMAGYMKNFPFRLSEARNGLEMLKLLPSVKPDIILLDLTMPEMDGFEAIQVIRKDAVLNHIPVIAVTASAFKEDEDRILQAGFNDYLRKPVSLTELVSSLCKFLPHELLITDEESGEPEWFEGIAYTITGEMIADFESRIMPEWKSLGTIKPQKTMLAFAEKIMDIGKKHDCIPVIRYGEALQRAVQSFNVDKQKTMVANLPEFIGQLKNHIQK